MPTFMPITSELTQPRNAGLVPAVFPTALAMLSRCFGESAARVRPVFLRWKVWVARQWPGVGVCFDAQWKLRIGMFVALTGNLGMTVAQVSIISF